MSPRVGKREFSYGPKGQAAAKKESQRSGKPVVQAKGGKKAK